MKITEQERFLFEFETDFGIRRFRGVLRTKGKRLNSKQTITSR